jgi:hypothetical protein
MYIKTNVPKIVTPPATYALEGLTKEELQTIRMSLGNLTGKDKAPADFHYLNDEMAEFMIQNDIPILDRYGMDVTQDYK